MEFLLRKLSFFFNFSKVVCGISLSLFFWKRANARGGISIALLFNYCWRIFDENCSIYANDVAKFCISIEAFFFENCLAERRFHYFPLFTGCCGYQDSGKSVFALFLEERARQFLIIKCHRCDPSTKAFWNENTQLVTLPWIFFLESSYYPCRMEKSSRIDNFEEEFFQELEIIVVL